MTRGSCGGTSLLPEGKQWLAHCGQRQQRRNLERSWKAFEALCATDDYAKGTRERLIELMSEHYPEEVTKAEWACMMVVMTAKLRVEEMGRSDLLTETNLILNSLETKFAEEAAKPHPRVAPSWFGQKA